MPHRSAVRAVGRWLWRHRRLAGRGLEALAAVVCLTLCHQAAWLVLRQATREFQDRYPDRVLWMRLVPTGAPAEPGTAPEDTDTGRSWDSDRGRIVVASDRVLVEVMAPLDESVVLRVEGREELSIRGPGVRLGREVQLLPGTNRIVAVLVERPDERAASVEVVYVPPDPATVEPGPLPMSHQEGAWVWRAAGETGPLFHAASRSAVQAREPRGPPPEAPTSLSGLATRLQDLQRQGWGRAATLLMAILAAVPMLFLLWVLRSYPRSVLPATRSTLYAIAATLLFFHFGILSASILSNGLGDLWRLVGPAEGSFELWALLDDLARVYPVSLIAIALLLGPLYRAFKSPEPPPRRTRRWVWSALRWLVFWPGVVVLPAVFVRLLLLARESGPGFGGGGGGGVVAAELGFATLGVLAAGLATLWFFLLWLLRAVAGRAVGVGAAVRASWAALLFPLVPPALAAAAGGAKRLWVEASGVYPFLLPRDTATLSWALIIAGVGTALLYQLTELTLRALRAPSAFRFLRSRWRWLVLALYLLVCLPLGWVLEVGGYRVVEVWDLAALAFRVDALVPALALLAVVLLMRRGNPLDHFAVPPAVRLAGVLAFAYFLVGYTVNLWFVPIPLLVGWVLFDRWVLERRQPEAGGAADPGTARAAEAVRGLIAYRQAQRLADQLPKKLEKQLGEGKLDLDQHAATVARLRHTAQRALQRLGAEGVPGARSAAFGRGPGQGPWENAMVALRHGAVLAIPFQLLTLWQILAATEIGNFPFLQLFAIVVRDVVLWWLVLAFLFGYFIHAIRGREGFTKAFTVAAAIALASIPYRLLASMPMFERDHLGEMLQILLFLLLVALSAFDLKTLAALGFRRRDFLAVHGLTTAFGYLGSIALTGLATYVGKDLGTLLERALGYFAGAGGG